MSEASRFREEAERCRQLALGADEQTTRNLLMLAGDYEARAEQLEALDPPESS
jgi:hypothetical protein